MKTLCWKVENYIYDLTAPPRTYHKLVIFGKEYDAIASIGCFEINTKPVYLITIMQSIEFSAKDFQIENNNFDTLEEAKIAVNKIFSKKYKIISEDLNIYS